MWITGVIANFKSGQIAQLVEQRIENPCVGGSIPPLATINCFLAVIFCLLKATNSNIIFIYQYFI